MTKYIFSCYFGGGGNVPRNLLGRHLPLGPCTRGEEWGNSLEGNYIDSYVTGSHSSVMNEDICMSICFWYKKNNSNRTLYSTTTILKFSFHELNTHLNKSFIILFPISFQSHQTGALQIETEFICITLLRLSQQHRND